jgi:hypothetical protein
MDARFPGLAVGRKFFVIWETMNLQAHTALSEYKPQRIFNSQFKSPARARKYLAP